MKFKKVIFTFLFFIFVLSPTSSSAQVVINEFYSATNDDWVEIYNASDENIDLSQYYLSDGSSSGNKKYFTCILLPKGFVVSGWGDSLNNAGDIIKLNKNEEIIDCVTYGNGAGNFCPNQSIIDLKKLETTEYATEYAMRENNGGSWKIVLSSTKGFSNLGTGEPEVYCILPTPTPTLTPTTEPTPTPSKTPTPTHTPSPTKTPTPTHTPTPSKTPTSTPQINPTNTPTVTIKVTPTITKSSSPTSTKKVLGNATASAQLKKISPTVTPTIKPLNKKSASDLPKVFLVFGGLFLLATAISLFFSKKINF